MTPEQRSLHARAMAYAQWAKEPDRAARSRLGYDGLLRRFEREVDPDGQLDPAERTRRAMLRHRSHMNMLALRSSIARAARKAETEAAAP